MKIGILIFSGPKHDEYTQAERFEEAGRDLGVEVVRIHEPLTAIRHDGDKTTFFADGGVDIASLALDAVICRPNFVEEPSLHQFTIQALQNLGLRVVNGSIRAPKNKLDQRLRLAALNIPMPRWAIAHRPEQAVAAAEEIGYPVIVKMAFGTHGKGVFFAPTSETLLPIIDYLAVRDKNPVIIEEFIKTRVSPPDQSGGVKRGSASDLRAFVLNGKVIAAMERVAKAGDVRANASIGGTGRPVTLSPEEERMAIAATEAFQLEISGVDILRSSRGPLVIEVNANPGFRELENVTGVNVAKAIIEFATKEKSPGV